MKINSLQVLRGGAAWLVVYHHYMQMFYDFKSDSLIGQIFSQRGGFGVDIFFVLSGFVMYLSATRITTSGFTFFTKRLFRVAPTYWFYTLLLIVFSYFFVNEFSFTSYTSGSLLSSLFFVPNENPSGLGVYPFLTVGWTLNLEISFYTILSLCIVFARNNSIVLCSIIVLALPVVLKLAHVDSVVFHALKNPLMWQFIFGFFVAYLYQKIKISPSIRLVTGTLLIVVSIIFLSGPLGYGIVQKTISATLLVLGFLLIDKIFDNENRITVMLVKLGDYSFSTYLSHILIIGVFLYFFGSSLTALSEIGVLLGITVIIYIVSALSFKWLENSKVVFTLRDRILLAQSKANKKIQADA